MPSPSGERPSWMTDDLDEEWPASPSPEPEAVRPSSVSQQGSLRLPKRVGTGSMRSVVFPGDSLRSSPSISNHGSLRHQRPPSPPSPTIARQSGMVEDDDDEPRAPGTFIVRADVPDSPAFNPLATPGAASGGGGGGPASKLKGGAIKGLFSPLALESLFEPPSPPAATNNDAKDDDASVQNIGPSSIPLQPSAALAPKPVVLTPTVQRTPSSRDTSSPSPSSSPSLSPLSRPAVSHVPPKPSRLAKAFTAEDMTVSSIAPTELEADEDADEEADGGPGACAMAARSEDEIVESDIPFLGAFAGRKQSSAFEFACPLPPPPPAVESSSSFASFGSPVQQARPRRRSLSNGLEEEDDNDSKTGKISGPMSSATASTTQLSIRTSDARMHGPALAAIIQPSPGQVSSSTGGKRLNLFQPQFDTFTRDFMNGLVDEIEATSSPASSSASSNGAARSVQRNGSRHHAAFGSPMSEDGATSDDLAFPAIKRVRLSPVATSRATSTSSNISSASAFSGGSSLERLRRSRAGATGTASSGGSSSAPKRDWEREAGEMMRRVRELGNSHSINGPGGSHVVQPTGVIGGGWGRGASISSSAKGETDEKEEEVDEESTEDTEEQGGTVRRRYEPPSMEATPPSPVFSDPASIPPTPPLRTSNISSSFASAQSPSSEPSRPEAKPSAYMLEAASIFARVQSASSTVSSSPSSSSSSCAPASSVAASAEGNVVDRFAELRLKRQSPRKMLRRMSAAAEIERKFAEEEDEEEEEGWKDEEEEEYKEEYGEEHDKGIDEEEDRSAVVEEDLPPLPASAVSLPKRGNIPSRPSSQSTQLSVAGSSSNGTISSSRTTLLGASSSSAPVPPAIIPDDLNRYVSSSTVLTTAGPSTISVSSFVKHAGLPPPTRYGRGRMISIPLEQAQTPQVFGRMQFDRDKMAWVKVRPAPGAAGGELTRVSDEDDPFRDMDSTRGSNEMKALDAELARREEAEQTAVQEAMGSSPAQPLLALAPRRAASSFDSAAFGEDTGRLKPTGVAPENETHDLSSLQSFQFSTSSVSSLASHEDESKRLSVEPTLPPRPLVHHANSAPPASTHASSLATPLPYGKQQPVARIASGGGLRPLTATPVSVLKKRSPNPSSMDASEPGMTPGSVAYRRSVSFSDGRKVGKIKDLSRVDRGETFFDDRSSRSAFLPSARTNRIQNMLQRLEDDPDFSDEGTSHHHEQTPSKTSQTASARAFVRANVPPSTTDADSTAISTFASASASTFDDSYPAPENTMRSSMSGARSFHYSGRRRVPAGEQTFLTEHSFGVTRDRLVELITDVHPFVAHWEDLTKLSLEGRGCGSVARLKEFLPQLIEVNLAKNDLDYLSGLPTSVETLHVGFNRLSGLTAVAHLPNLQYLDLSNNQLDAVHQLSCLRHLRELKLDNNAVSDVSPLFGLMGLLRLSVAGNALEGSVDFSDANWSRLESINLAQNKIDRLEGAHRLTSLTSLTLDDNSLDFFDPARSLARLRVLRICQNNLRQLDIGGGGLPELRTLYADGNKLERINVSGGRTKLEKLSLRAQQNSSSGALALFPIDLRHVKRLFLSGNPLPPTFFAPLIPHQSPSGQGGPALCPSLVYLELASCKLASLPAGFASFASNVRALNLNYNFLVDVAPLTGMQQLAKLSVVGSRLDGTRMLLRTLRTLPGLEEVDLRMNPCTLAMYLPLLLSASAATARGAPSASASTPSPTSPDFPASTHASIPSAAQWADLDDAFRRQLPDTWYIRRLAHRGLVMRACPRIGTLDGIVVGEGERRKASELLDKVERRAPSSSQSAMDGADRRRASASAIQPPSVDVRAALGVKGR